MRIVISSPDGIGDFVLREPLWAALVAGEHQLLFLTRAPTRAAAETIVPTASTWEIPEDPYEHFPQRDSAEMMALARRLRKFRADLIIIAPYVHTWFDNWLVSVLTSVTAIGFAGRMYPAGVATLAAPLVDQLTPAVEVCIDAAETTKNHALAEAVLQRRVAWRAPQLRASPTAQQQMRAKLSELGWCGKSFRVACVGDGPRNRHINWPSERWADLLRHARERHGWRFVLIGDAAERATNRKIAQLTGASASQLICLDDPPLSFAELTALVSLAEGYVGRDSGPMHIAAALGKPVLSVFAGGCWPRFLPSAVTGKAFALSVPCAGCGNFCHLPACYCIQELPLAPVVAGLDDIVHDPQEQFTVHVLPRPTALAERMEREAAATGRERAWQLAQRCQPLKPTPVVYGRGWYVQEFVGESVFRWMGQNAVAELRLDGSLPQRLCGYVEHAIHPDSRETLRLQVEGQDVPIDWDSCDPRRWSATIPPDLVSFPDHLRITMSAAAFRPCDLLPSSPDQRWVSIAISDLRLEPLALDASSAAAQE